MLGDVLVGAVYLVLLVTPPIGVWRAIAALRDRAERRDEELEDRGSVHRGDLAVTVGGIVILGAALLLGAGLLPLLVWIVDGDAEAARVVLVMGVVTSLLGAPAILAIARGLRSWVLTDHELLVVPLRGRTRVLPLDASTAVTLRHRPITTLVVRATDGTTTRVPATVAGFDLLVDRLAPSVTGPGRSSVTAPVVPAAASGEAATRTSWSVPTSTLVGIGGLLGGLFLLAVAGPWLIDVEDPAGVGDRLAFTAVFLVVWGLIALAVMLPRSPRRAPIRLAVQDGALVVTTLLGDPRIVPRDRIVAVTVVPTTFRVRGVTSRRDEVVVLVTDGERVDVGFDRLRDLRTPAQQLAAGLRTAVAALPVADSAPARVQRAHAAAATALTDGRWREAAEALEVVAAADPGPDHDGVLVRAGDAWRRAGDGRRAVACYLAHLDRHPDDAAAWERVAAAYHGLRDPHLAADATATAERLLLRRT